MWVTHDVNWEVLIGVTRGLVNVFALGARMLALVADEEEGERRSCHEVATGAVTRGVATGAVTRGAATGAVTRGVATGAVTRGAATGAVTRGAATGAVTRGAATGAVTRGAATGAVTRGVATGAVTRGVATGAVTQEKKAGLTKKDWVQVASVLEMSDGALAELLSISQNEAEKMTSAVQEFQEKAELIKPGEKYTWSGTLSLTMRVYVMNDKLQVDDKGCFTGSTAGSENVYTISNHFKKLDVY